MEPCGCGEFEVERGFFKALTTLRFLFEVTVYFVASGAVFLRAECVGAASDIIEFVHGGAANVIGFR
jgi:hypothetical protein